MSDLVRGQGANPNDGGMGMNAGGTVGQLISEGETIQQVRTQYVTAVTVQKKRDPLPEIVARVVEEAELLGAAAYYTWIVHSWNGALGRNEDKIIEGPSINLAMASARNYGNLAIEQLPLEVHPTFTIFRTAVIDLETGFTYTGMFREDKQIELKGKMSDARKRNTQFQKSVSMSTRNGITKALSFAIHRAGVEAAKGTVRLWVENQIRDLKSREAFVKATVTRFAKYQVTEKMMIQKFGGPSAKWDIETLVLLLGDLEQLKNNEATTEQLYGHGTSGNNEQPPADQGGNLSTDNMQMGDPGTHQGHEQSADQAKPDDPKASAGQAPPLPETTPENEPATTAPKDNGPQVEKEPDDLKLNF